MDITYFKQPLRTLRAKYYAELFRSKYYKRLVMINPRKAVELKWRANYGRMFDLNNPQTLDEKIAWLQLNTDTSLWSRLADKLSVREYVIEKGLGDILVPLLGVWNRIEKIDFASLPQSFAIKCTHDSGSTYIVRDKEHENMELLRMNLHRHFCKKCGYESFEPHYLNIEPRVIAEQLLEGSDVGGLIDYKIWCFNGKPFCALVCYDRHRMKDDSISCIVDLYQLNPWKPMRDGLSLRKRNSPFRDIPRPKNFDDMLHYATVLSEGLPQVRVDFYDVNGRIFLSELTCTASGGIQMSYSEDMLIQMGAAIDLSKVNEKN